MNKASPPAHLLVTRFSVRLDSTAVRPSDDWLFERLQLFRHYTLPSVLSQTSPPDVWIVVCGPSPGWLSDELADVCAEAKWITIVETDDVFSPALARDLMRQALPPASSRVITTRLDSDDVIASNYLQELRTFSLRNDQFINFTRGLQLARGRLYHRSDPSNSFISLVENTESMRGVFVDQHQLLARHAPILQVHSAPMWLQVVHGGNLSNVARGIRADPRKVSASFNIPLQLHRSSTMALRVHQVASTARLAGRTLRKPARVRWALKVLRKPTSRNTGATGKSLDSRLGPEPLE